MPNDNCQKIADIHNRFSAAEKIWQETKNRYNTDRTVIRSAREAMRTIHDSIIELKPFFWCGPEKAKEIFGADFFGPESVKKVFDIDVPAVEIPEVRFKVVDMYRAKARGERLILRIAKDGRGMPLTMRRMLDIMAPRMKDKEKILADQAKSGDPKLKPSCWYRDQKFFKDETLKTEWVFVAKEPVTDFAGLSHISQILWIQKYLAANKLMTIEEKKENEALTEKLKALCAEAGIDWQRQAVNAADQFRYEKNWKNVVLKLSKLPINMLYRRTIPEAFYDELLTRHNSVRYPNRADKFEATSNLSSYFDFVSLKIDFGKGSEIRREQLAKSGSTVLVARRHQNA